MAIDKEAIVMAAHNGWAIPTWHQFAPDLAGVSSQGIRSFDPEGARALLAEHGINPASLDSELIITSDEGASVAEVIQSNLADIGITVTISRMDHAAFLSTTTAGLHELAIASFARPSLLEYMRAVVHGASIGGNNRSKYNNPEMNELIDRAIATIDIDARLAILYEASRLANYDVIYVPTNNDIVIRAFNSRLRQPEISANGFNFMNMIYWAE